MHRTTTVARAALAGTAVGTAAAVVLWALVTVVTAIGHEWTAAESAAASLAVAPVLVVGAAVLGVGVGLVLAAAAPVLHRGGAPAALALVVVSLLAFVVWGSATSRLVSKEAFFVDPVVPSDTTVLVAGVLGAVAGAGVTVVAARGRLPLPDARAGRTVLLWVVVGAVVGLVAWWLRRSGVALVTGMPTDGSFVGSGFGDTELPITLEWIWGVVTGAFAGYLVAVVQVLSRRRWVAVVAAALVAAVAAFVSARTGLMFPSLDPQAFTARSPFVGGFATSVGHLPLGAVLVTVALWAAVAAVVAGAVTTTAARLSGRGGRASRPV